MKLEKSLLFFVGALTFLPQLVAAQVFISEIMYNPAGNDADREWLEICGDTAADLNGWKFFEQGSNHGLADFRGGLNLPAGSCAIIVSDPNLFLADFPSYAGIILDSSWSSFNNTAGEELAIKDNALNIIGSVIYNVGLGANDDGNSLQKVNGAWMTAAPTPGTASTGSPANLEVQPPNGGVTAETGSQSTWADYVPPEKTPQIKIEIITPARSEAMIAGAAQKIEARVYGVKNEPIDNARVIWNFGDGARGEGKSALHSWHYPGQYLVVADASSGVYAASARVLIGVTGNIVYLSEVYPGLSRPAGEQAEALWIEVANPGAVSADLSGWMLEAGDGRFILPENSIIAPKSFAVFSGENIKLEAAPSGAVRLLYPNTKEADRLDYAGDLAAGQSFQRVGGNISVAAATPGTAAKIISVARPQKTEREIAVQHQPNDEVILVTQNNQTAATARAMPERGGNLFSWLALSLLLGLAGAAAFVLRGNYSS